MSYAYDFLMPLLDLLWQIPAVVITVGVGLAFHEFCHYVGGWLSGGEPEYQRYWYGIPTQVDFLSSESMSNVQIRITGGVVMLWPIITFGLSGYIIATGEFILFPMIGFFGGASGVSWLDLLAAYNPELWRRFTEGGVISREDLPDSA